MTLHSGSVNTVFTGEVKDQSQLYGLLDRLRDLGLELISVQPQPEGAPEYLAAPDFGEGVSRPTEIGGVPILPAPRSHRSHDAVVNSETQP
jgi:hypothetical protein